jgi:hypothetical protein
VNTAETHAVILAALNDPLSDEACMEIVAQLVEHPDDPSDKLAILTGLLAQRVLLEYPQLGLVTDVGEVMEVIATNALRTAAVIRGMRGREKRARLN